MMKAVPLLLSLAMAGVLFSAVPVQAQVFKCKGPNGGVVYQDGPCEGASVVDTRTSSGVSRPKNGGRSGGGSAPVSTKPTHPVVPEKMRR
jgi:hypothetical protein